MLGALTHTHQFERNREDFEDITLRVGRLTDSPLALSALLAPLANQESDFTGLALKCLVTCITPEPSASVSAPKGQ